MILIVHDINTSVYQTLIPNSNQMVGAVRPHLYIHNNPAGSLKVQITADDGTLIAESNTVAISTITSAPEFHGHVTFNIDANLKRGVKYRFYVIGTGGYSFNLSAYCGVCNDYDSRIYPLENPINTPGQAPLDIQIWSYQQK